MNRDAVVIISGARTPMGALLGSLSTVPAPELAATAISATLARSGIQASDIDEVFMGCVLPLNSVPPARLRSAQAFPPPPGQSP